MHRPLLTAILSALACSPVFAAAANPPYLHAPSVNSYAKFDPMGTTILPDGRLLKPAGKHFPVDRWPNTLAVTGDGSMVFVGSAHMGQFVTGWDTASPKIDTLAPEPERVHGDKAYGAAVFSPDGQSLYWSSGDTGQVYVVDVASRKVTSIVSLNGNVDGKTYEDSEVVDVKTSGDGKYLYCADVTNFRIAIIDTATRQVIGSSRVGRYPYALTVSDAPGANGTVKRMVYVANIGMYEYSSIPKPTDGKSDPRGLTFPAYGVPSKEAKEGVTVEGREVPGLGDPNVPDSFSVWGVDATDAQRPHVVSRVKTGLMVGAVSDAGKTVGGSGPNYLVTRGNTLYVSNNNNDLISRIDLRTGKIIKETRIVPSPLTAKLRGVSPTGMAMSQDGKRLYVAEMGLNAIGVLDAATGRIIGHIPTAWYPYRVSISPDGRSLLAICFRGFGNGPSAGKDISKSPYANIHGSFHVIPIPADRDLAGMTKDVLAYEGLADKSSDRAAMASPIVPARPGVVSPQIKYVVFITKENHTYDTIFDHIPGANDDPSLLAWGLHQHIKAEGQPSLDDVPVMTNHNALARQFTVSDNFYMQPEASGVGHRWLVGVQPNNWCQMTYTLRYDFKADSTAPGRRASFSSNGSIAPEDYPEAGSMWDHLANHGIRFRNYGEGFEFAGVGEDADEHKTGAREVVNIPMPKPLFDSTCRDYPIFNMNIPDQYRAAWFSRDVAQQFLSGKNKMPSFLNIAICNDHGSDPDPAHGYPYIASWMADNDLALGKIVDFLSHTPYWKNMAIFVTQDDSGGEADHVDAQRSVMLVISPWARHKYVSHRHTTILSMHRTLYEILGLPPLNLGDAVANDLLDCFTDKPNFTPYTATPVDPRIFDPEKAKDPKDPDYQIARQRPSIKMDDADDMEHLLAEEKK